MPNGQLRTAAALLSIAILLWGCQAAPPEPKPAPPELPAETVEPAAEVVLPAGDILRTAITLLQDGSVDSARHHLESYLEDTPKSRVAKNLIAQIDTPIAEYFPEEHFTVTLARGESLSSVAKTYLNDALKFYALARYNQIDKPAQVVAGQSIRVPATASAIAAREALNAPANNTESAAEVQDVVEAATPVAAQDPQDAVQGATSDVAVDAVQEQTADTEADLLTLAETAANSGDFASAIDLARRARQNAADDPAVEARIRALESRAAEYHYQQAVSAFSRQDLSATISHADAVLDIDPGHTNARVYKTRALELQQKLEALNTSADG